MHRISPIFTRESPDERTELLRAPKLSTTPYPFQAESTYIPPEPAQPKPQAYPQPERTRIGLWNSIAMRFSGFSAQMKAAVEPLNGVRRSSIARNFFANRLSETVELASKNPEASHRIIASSTLDARPLWRNLLLVACGDGNSLAPALSAIEETHDVDEAALADCIAMVAKARPREGRHLARHAVRYVGAKAQVRMLHMLVDGKTSESKRLVGDLFESMMERSTPAERKADIYPGIARIVSEDIGRKSPGRGLLGALLRGWLSEAPAAERTIFARA